jgi:integrase
LHRNGYQSMGIRRRFGRFYLDAKPDLLGQLPLMYEFTYGGYYDENGRHIRYRVRHSTGFKIPGKKTNTKKGPKFVYWDDLQQYARGFMDAEEINGYVIALINRVSKYVRHQKESFEPIDLSEIKRLITVNHSVSHENIVSYCEAYLNRYDKPGQESTKRNLSTMVSSLKEYTENRPPLLANISKAFLEAFISWLINTKKNNNTTVEKKLSMLQQMLREAHKQGLLTDKSALEEVKISRGTTDIIFLKQEELQALEKYKPKSERLEKLKDAFLFGCYTGLRYSDLEQLNQAHYHKKTSKGEQYHVLSFVIKKTRRMHEIALPPKAVAIVKRYWDQQEEKRLLPMPSNQKFNDYLKELCEDADIDTEIEIAAQFGSEVRTEIKKKFEIISCHSSRHTYAILSLENGMRPEVLQRNLGHSKLSQTMEYVTILDNVRHFETLRAFSA